MRQASTLAWSPDGAILYGFRNSSFGTIDPTSAEFTEIGDSGLGFVGGMAFQPGTGTLFAVQNQAWGLYTLDLTTGEATLVGDPGAAYNSLVFLADGTLLAGVDAAHLTLRRTHADQSTQRRVASAYAVLDIPTICPGQPGRAHQVPKIATPTSQTGRSKRCRIMLSGPRRPSCRGW